MTGLLGFEPPTAPPRKGLLGLGGIGGAQPPAGLLGPYFDPSEMKRQQMKQMLLSAGIGLLKGGVGSTGQVIGQAFAGGLERATWKSRFKT